MPAERKDLQKENPYIAVLKMLKAAAEKINLNRNTWEPLRSALE